MKQIVVTGAAAPSLSGYMFASPSIICSNVTSNLNNQDFTATSVGIVETHCNASLRVYPNPVNGQLIIDNVEIYNVVGQKLNNYQLSIVNSQLIIDISHLATGMYFLRIGNKTARFVKE